MFKCKMMFTAYSVISYIPNRRDLARTHPGQNTCLTTLHFYSTKQEACDVSSGILVGVIACCDILLSLSGGHCYSLIIVKDASNFAGIFLRQPGSCKSGDPNADQTPIL